ncbi:glycosyltransferase [Oscillatoria laete-virens NRMC-F 0139]|nr:glycosyltransferase [Oscillatoria laete-virens]MDL5052910.1 glycosyltransferase [Oscillatoria laete-virens NRMC-F 0139]
MNIAFITHYNLAKQSKRPSHLIGNFGSSYYMAKSLEKQGENVTYLSPLIEGHNFKAKLFNRFYKAIHLKNYAYWAEQSASKNYARQIEEKISKIRPDILMCPHANLIAYLNTNIPLVLWTDSLYRGLLDVFPQGKPSLPSIKDLTKIDKLATQKCDLLIFSSDWAAQIAIQQYDVSPTKVKVVPTGANLESPPNFQEVQQNILSKSLEVCKLLFIGVDWYRKGGDIALSIAQRLNQLNLKTELYLVGCQPPNNERLPNFVHSIGFVDRSTRAGTRKKLKTLS